MMKSMDVQEYLKRCPYDAMGDFSFLYENEKKNELRKENQKKATKKDK